MATTSAVTPQTLRDPLAEPPRDRNVRYAPRRSGSSLTSLARGSDDSEDEPISTPEGESIDPYLDETSELDSHPVVQAFEHLGMAKAHLEVLGTLMPATMLVVQDLITLLMQIVPQQAAAMVSGTAMSPAMGAGTGPPLAAGGPPMMGLQQLAGQPPVGAPMQGGMGGGGGMPAMPATPGAGLGMAM